MWLYLVVNQNEIETLVGNGQEKENFSLNKKLLIWFVDFVLNVAIQPNNFFMDFM